MLNNNITIKLNADDEHKIAKLVQMANEFESEIHLIKDNTQVNCKSIMGVLAFDLKNNLVVNLKTSGSDETEAFEKIKKYLEEGLYV